MPGGSVRVLPGGAGLFQGDHVGEAAAGGNQFLRRAALGHPARGEQDDTVGVTGGGDPVGNGEDGGAGGERAFPQCGADGGVAGNRR